MNNRKLMGLLNLATFVLSAPLVVLADPTVTETVTVRREYKGLTAAEISNMQKEEIAFRNRNGIDSSNIQVRDPGSSSSTGSTAASQSGSPAAQASTAASAATQGQDLAEASKCNAGDFSHRFSLDEQETAFSAKVNEISTNAESAIAEVRRLYDEHNKANNTQLMPTELVGRIQNCAKFDEPDRFQKKLESCYIDFRNQMTQTEASLNSLLLESCAKKTDRKFSASNVSLSRSSTQKFSQITAELQLRRDACFKNLESGELCSIQCNVKDLPQDVPEATIVVQKFFGGKGGTKTEKAQPGVVGVCQKELGTIIGKYDAAALGASEVSGSSLQAWKTFKTGALIGGAAIVGGAIYLDKKSDKKEEKKKKEAEADFKNAIVKGDDGEKIDCKSTGTYMKAECKDVLTAFCAKEENASKGGCQAFATHVCSGADNTSGFCTYGASKNYCTSGGVGAAQSPSCQWVSSRPASCAKTPNEMSCLAKISESDLEKVCSTYNTDPICQRYATGKLLTQPNASNVVSRGTSSDGATTGTSSLSSLVGVGGTASNLWRSNSAAVQKLCQNGQMVGCTPN